MLKEESLWIKDILAKADLSSVKEILDIGSSTKEFRTKKQPYIDKNIFKQLREKNKNIYYLDQKLDDGVDLVYDIEKMKADEIGKKFDLIICCNLLEHVKDPIRLINLLTDLVKKNGFLLVTVPRAYRYHPDPIDTMFRPSLKKLISIFSEFDVINKSTVRLRNRGKYKRKELIRFIIPFLNWRVSCLFLKKH